MEKFNQSMNSNMSAMKEVEKLIKNGSVFCSGYHTSISGEEQDQQLMYITNVVEEVLTYRGVGWQEKEQKQSHRYIRR